METQKMISEWADETFGKVTQPITSLTRVNKEVAELLHEFAVAPNATHDPHVGAELADIEIVLRRIATTCGFNLQQEVDKKMAINRRRKWKLDGSGHAQHID